MALYYHPAILDIDTLTRVLYLAATQIVAVSIAVASLEYALNDSNDISQSLVILDRNKLKRPVQSI